MCNGWQCVQFAPTVRTFRTEQRPHPSGVRYSRTSGGSVLYTFSGRIPSRDRRGAALCRFVWRSLRRHIAQQPDCPHSPAIRPAIVTQLRVPFATAARREHTSDESHFDRIMQKDTHWSAGMVVVLVPGHYRTVVGARLR